MDKRPSSRPPMRGSAAPGRRWAMPAWRVEPRPAVLLSEPGPLLSSEPAESGLSPTALPQSAPPRWALPRPPPRSAPLRRQAVCASSGLSDALPRSAG